MEEIERIYSIQNEVLFAIVLVAEIYVIGWTLRFRLDKAGYIILINQLLIMIFKIFRSLTKQEIQSVLVLVSYTVSEATLFYFVFEMRFVQLKTQCSTLDEYIPAKLRAHRIKYAIFAIYIFHTLAWYSNFLHL